MASYPQPNSGESDYEVFKRASCGDESAVSAIFSRYCSRPSAYWSARYFPSGEYGQSDLEADLYNILQDANWQRLQDWDPKIPLNQYLVRWVIEVCHIKVKALGLSGPLVKYEEDWTLRDRVIGKDDQSSQNMLARCRPQVIYFSFLRFPRGQYDVEDAMQDLAAHVMKNDGHVLWIWRGDCSLNTHLNRIVASIVGQKRRKELRSPLFASTTAEEGEAPIEWGKITPHRNVNDRIVLLKAIEQLSQERDRIYFHRILQGHHPDDAGWGLTENPNAFYQFKKRAFERLRGILKEMGY